MLFSGSLSSFFGCRWYLNFWLLSSFLAVIVVVVVDVVSSCKGCLPCLSHCQRHSSNANVQSHRANNIWNIVQKSFTLEKENETHSRCSLNTVVMIKTIFIPDDHSHMWFCVLIYLLPIRLSTLFMSSSISSIAYIVPSLVNLFYTKSQYFFTKFRFTRNGIHSLSLQIVSRYIISHLVETTFFYFIMLLLYSAFNRLLCTLDTNISKPTKTGTCLSTIIGFLIGIRFDVCKNVSRPSHIHP